jgi:hypothetical protein
VVYRIEDLQSWADLGTKYSTSDPGQNDLLPRPENARPQDRA